MKPLLTTVSALRHLATGVSPMAVGTAAALAEMRADECDVLVAADDHALSRRILVMRDEHLRDSLVPDTLGEHRRQVLSRMASFVERARIVPLSLPRGWGQYKFDNLVAFFAVPNGDAMATRWIAEVLPGERSDVVFWRTTTRNEHYNLEEFSKRESRKLPDLDALWSAGLAEGRRKFETKGPAAPDVDAYLPAAVQTPGKGWSFEEWMRRVSPDQMAFIQASSDKSIRLRGPAGSGKTLALTLKAVREAASASRSGVDCRVLIATHSWSLATQIQESLDAMGLESLGSIDVFPLLEIADTIAPQAYREGSGVSLIGEDSYSGKQALLDEIVELLEEFVGGDWITYKAAASERLRSRLESPDDDARLALAWDLLIEFGSVMGPAAIFPGAGADLRYYQITRATWMLPLDGRGDLRVVYELYRRYIASLDARSLVTSDQVLADFLNYLETHAWNRGRRTHGYDMIFVDEFHLFNPLERQVIHYLTRDVSVYPRIFMAVDPRQSPSEAFIGVAADETESLGRPATDDGMSDVASFDLTTVHRFTPQVLELVKHVHLDFPTLELGSEWAVDLRDVESAVGDGPVPRLVTAGSRSAEESDLYRAVDQLYQRGRMAIAVVDMRQWARFSDLASRLAASRRFHVATIAGRDDVEGLGYRRRGIVVAPAEHLAGMQFESVLVAGVPDMGVASYGANDRVRMLSLLYLALTRAQHEARIFVNEDDGGAPEVLLRAVGMGVLQQDAGSAV